MQSKNTSIPSPANENPWKSMYQQRGILVTMEADGVTGCPWQTPSGRAYPKIAIPLYD